MSVVLIFLYVNLYKFYLELNWCELGIQKCFQKLIISHLLLNHLNFTVTFIMIQIPITIWVKCWTAYTFPLTLVYSYTVLIYFNYLKFIVY